MLSFCGRIEGKIKGARSCGLEGQLSSWPPQPGPQSLASGEDWVGDEAVSHKGSRHGEGQG